jgi:pyruvate dehydrogenase E2 component (dihydrolipoamide acetyltransferase)
MSTDIAMPRLSDSMEEGTIISWLVDDGQPIAAGDDLVEIETDKAAATHAADTSGVLRIAVAAGTKCAVGTVIARVEPVDGAVAPTAGTDLPVACPPTVSSPGGARSAAASPVAASPRPASQVDDSMPVLATPLAKRAAAVHGVRLDAVNATGPRGRITQSDVLVAAGIAAPAAPEAPSMWTSSGRLAGETVPPDGRGERTVVVPTRLQQSIAERMAQTVETIPAFQVQTEVDADRLIALRQSLKDISTDGAVPSLNDFVLRAAALALSQFPLANASYTEAGFEHHSRINIGVAVAAEGALVVPTVFDVDRKPLATIAAESRRLAERVRSGTISPAELAGGTFTVSNLGMYGMTAITPVINPPQAAILGVGGARRVLARDAEGEIVDRTLVTLTLSCDHRILYGAEASRFLATVRTLLETPLRLAL